VGLKHLGTVMLGTHSVKLFDARIKQQSLIANIIADIPHYLVCSKTVELRQKYWNLPVNAADLKKEFTDKSERIPDFAPSVKQVLLPYKDSYIAVAPVPSAGLIHEMYQRVRERKYFNKTWVIQPTPQAIGNHGETLVRQGGRVRMLYAFTRLPKETIQPIDCVAIRFKVYHANVSSGFVSCGMPSIASVGGLVHAIERDFGGEIEFAVGYRDIEVSDSATLGSQRQGDKSRKVLITSEVVANLDVTLLLRSDKGGLYEYMQDNQINRFAGGSVFECRLVDAVDVKFLQSVKVKSDKRDTLNSAITLYKSGLRKHKTPYTLLHSGYALLEEPKPRDNARNGCLSAWAEPVFSIVRLVDLNNDCWFSRKEQDGLVLWDSCK
jgi:hypothetical protein